MTDELFTKKSFDLGTASLAVLVAFGLQILFQAFLLIFPLSRAAYTWAAVIANQIIFLGASILFCVLYKVHPLEVTGVKRPPKWYYFPIFALIALCCILCFAPISGIFSRLLTQLGYEHNPQYYVPMDNGGLFTLAFLGLTIFPALGEETALRGVLMSGAKKKSPLFAILYTAMIFAFMHGNLHQIVHQFLLGAVMGYLAYLFGGIYASATVHFCNNGFALLLEYGRANEWISKTFYWYVGGKLGAQPTLIGMSIALFALLMFLVLVTCLRHRERSKTEEYYPSDGKFFERITAYLMYLSASDDAGESREIVEGEVKSLEKGVTPCKKPLDRFSALMAIILAAVMIGVVLLTLIPGATR